MSAKNCKLTISIKRHWWVTPYLWTLIFLCWLMRTEPDEGKVTAFLIKFGHKVKVG